MSVELGHTDVFPDATTPAPNLPQKLPTKPLTIIIPPCKFSGTPFRTASTSSTMALGSPLAPPGHSQTVVPASTITAHSHGASDPNDIPTLGLHIPNVCTSTADSWRDVVKHWVHSVPELGLETSLKDWPREWLTGANQCKFTMKHHNCSVIAKEFLDV